MKLQPNQNVKTLIISSIQLGENHLLPWTKNDLEFQELQLLDPELHALFLEGLGLKDALGRRVLELASSQGFGHIAVLMPYGREDRLVRMFMVMKSFAREWGIRCQLLKDTQFQPPLEAGPRVRQVRETLQKRANAFADHLGITRMTLYNWEDMRIRPKNIDLWGVAGATGSNFFWLKDGRGEPFGTDLKRSIARRPSDAETPDAAP